MELFDHGYLVTTRVLHSNDGLRSNTSQYLSLKVKSINRLKYWGLSVWILMYLSDFLRSSDTEEKVGYNETVHHLFLDFKKASSGMLRHVALVRTDILEELSASIQGDKNR
jgi:hypothetical protein